MVFIILYEYRSKSRLIHWSLVHGGAGGSGGQGGKQGGPGGPGEGPKFDIRDSNVTFTDPHATSMLFYGLENF
jgi:hypothetical protein